MSIKEDLAYLLQLLNEKETIVITPNIRLILLETLSTYENLYYELETWKGNYQTLEKESFVRGQRCLKYHVTDRPRKDQYVRLVSEYKCGICSEKLLYEKFMDRYDSDKFLCDICLKSKQIAGGVYHCKHCKFDVCNSCPDLLNIQKYRVCQKCNHQLYYIHAITDPITGKYSCFLCDNEYIDRDGVFACENCEFKMCNECEKEFRKKQLFHLLKKNFENMSPPNKEAFDMMGAFKSAGSKKTSEKAKKGGLQLRQQDEELKSFEPPEFQIKEEDLLSFSAKKSEELAELEKPEAGGAVSQPLQADNLSYERPQLRNDSFSLKNETIQKSLQPIGDFPLKTDGELFPPITPVIKPTFEASVQPYDFREPLPWSPKKYSESYRKI